MIRRCLLHLAMAVVPCVALLAAPSVSQAGLFGPRPVVAYYPAYPAYRVGYAGTYNVGYSPYGYTTSYAPYVAAYAPYTYSTTAYYAPTAYTSYYAPAYTSYYAAPVVAAPVVAAPACSSCQTCNYAPQTCYRTVYSSVPVTTYRPIVTTDACTGCSTTTMQAVTSYSLQPQVVAYTAAYAPCGGTCNTCNTCAAAPACSSCAGTTTNYAPAPAPTCSSCGGATVGAIGSTTTASTLATNPAPAQAPVMNNTTPAIPTTPNAPSSISSPSSNRTFLDPTPAEPNKNDSSLQKFPEESTSRTRPTSIFEKPDRTARLATPATEYHQVSLREKTSSPAPLDNSHWKAAK